MPGRPPLLPPSLADFEARGFHLHRPASRAVLETHARTFLAGFDLAARTRGAPHNELARVEPAERGFAYEGAGMYAALVDAPRGGRGGALAALLAGPGDRYAHLIHVGAGWYPAPARLPLPTLPATPLLRWLALDGHGFARTFFGGLRALRRMSRRSGPVVGERAAARLSGAGRALWFVTCADVHLAARIVTAEPPAVARELWAGLGLAACYAGGAGATELDALRAHAGTHAAALGQGVTFGAGARVRAGHVPPHTELACERLVGVDAAEAAARTDRAAARLTGDRSVAAYGRWRAELRSPAVAPAAEVAR